MPKYDTKPYIKSIEDYRDALVSALKVANDPFKAPELSVFTAYDVQKAAYQMQVQYAAMIHYKENETDEG